MTCEQLTLHVGVPRTGTTTIQSFLDANRKCLHDHGIFYVGPACLRSYPHEPGFEKEERLYGGIQELKQRLERNGGNRVLWSNEALSRYCLVKNAKNLQMIRRELPASRYLVVIYLRRQDHYVRSSYLQWGIKCKFYPGRVLDFNDWLRITLGDDFQNLLDANLDYPGLIQPWIDAFGRENVVIRAFEKGQFLNGDLIEDFCNAAEVPTTNCTFDVPNKNVSYNMELHDMLGMYNAVFEDSFFSAAMLQFMEHQGEDEFFSRPFFSRFAIPAKCRIEILRRCEESNRKVAKELLGREDGVLFREPWPRPDETHQSYGGLTTEKLVPIFLHMLQKQHGAIQEQHNRIRELERLVKQLNFAGVIRAVLRKMKRRITSLVTLGRNGANEEWQEKLDASVRPQDLSPRSSDAGQNGTCREKPHFGASTGSVAAGSH